MGSLIVLKTHYFTSLMSIARLQMLTWAEDSSLKPAEEEGLTPKGILQWNESEVIRGVSKCDPSGSYKFYKTKSVQRLEAHNLLLLAISETTVELSLSIDRWKLLTEQNINM